MINVRVDELAAGTVLAADVEDTSGHKMLSAGTIITEKHLALLVSRQILDVMIDETAAPEATEEAGEDCDGEREDTALDAARERLANLFAGDGQDKWTSALHEEAEKRLTVARFWATKV
jgi:hypothetical protein